MRFLADANVEAAIVHWLRAEGHDVLSAADFPAPCPDDHILEMADRQNRILITSDRDFGELVFRHNLASQGIILMRFQTPLQEDRLNLLRARWQTIVETAARHFTVLTDSKLRVRPLP